MPVHWDKDKKRWRFSFRRVIGGRLYRSTKRLPRGWDRTRAEAWDQKETARLYAVATGIERSEPLIDDAVQFYLQRRGPELRNGPIVMRELAGFLSFYEGKQISELPAVAEAYRKATAHELAPATVRNRLAYLRAAVRYEWRARRPADRAPPPLVMPEVRNRRHFYLEQHEQERLLAAIEDPEARALFTLSYYVGARWRSEVLPRQPEDVKVVRNEEGKLERWLDCGLTKNGLPVMKPVLHPAAIKALKFLPFQRGRTHYHNAFMAAREKVGLDHIVPHDGRHSLASQIISAGGTLSDVQGALGQTSVQAAHRYSHLYQRRLRDVMAKVGGGRKVRPLRRGRKP